MSQPTSIAESATRAASINQKSSKSRRYNLCNDDVRMRDFKDMTEAELDQPATRRDLRELWSHVDASSEEVRRHFDVVYEKFRADFANLFDWTQSTTSTMGKRI